MSLADASKLAKQLVEDSLVPEKRKQFNILKIRKALAGIDPENRIAADVNKFPAGMLPMNGWFSQMRLCLHSSQNWVIRTNEPITTVMAVQYTHMLKSNSSMQLR